MEVGPSGYFLSRKKKLVRLGRWRDALGKTTAVSAFPGPLPSTVSPGAKDVADSGGTVFNEVMAAYSGLVFSTALRKLPRDAESAREVTQNVFLMAFRKREVFATLAYPAAWFHRAAMLESNNFLRLESRRRKHLEACTAEQSVIHDEASAGLSKAVRAQLDEALHGLREPERELILSRFFEGRSFQELAERRGSTPDAVRMKLTRILEKLSSVLKRQGATVTIAALAAGLGAQWSHAAPAGLGAAVAAAKTGTAVTASKLNLLLAAMTSGKILCFSLMLLLFMLISLHFQSGRIDHLRAALEKPRVALEGRVPRSSQVTPENAENQLGVTARPGQKPDEESGPVTVLSLLNAIRSPRGSQRDLDGTYLVTKVDDRLAGMSAKELRELLEKMDQSPGGAGIKSRARSHLIERFLVKKDPEEALRQAIRYRMSDTAFMNIARRWAGSETGGSLESAFALLNDPSALPVVKFGADPAKALRQGIAAGLAARNDLPAAIRLCREAAGTPAAADYLLGMTEFLCRPSERDTAFDLLTGVPDAVGRTRLLKSLAVEIGRYEEDASVRAFFSDSRFPEPVRREVILEAAANTYYAEMGGSVSKALNLIENGSDDNDHLEIMTSWLRQNEAPSSPTGRTSPLEAEATGDAITERSLRLAARQDPVLAGKWLYGIRNPQRRDAIARELNLSVP